MDNARRGASYQVGLFLFVMPSKVLFPARMFFQSGIQGSFGFSITWRRFHDLRHRAWHSDCIAAHTKGNVGKISLGSASLSGQRNQTVNNKSPQLGSDSCRFMIVGMSARDAKGANFF